MASPLPLEIFHLSLHDPSKPTVLFLHGIFCSHLEFAFVTPYLKEYNVVLVDLPGHSRSNAAPLTLDNTIESILKLIKEQTPTGKAHIVGLSFGGFIALEFARQHPEAINSIFASGATPFRGGQRWLAQHPRILYIMLAMIFKTCPDWIYWWLCRRMGILQHEELRAEMKKNMTLDVLRRGYGECLRIGMDEIGEIEGVRVALVAGGKQDDVDMVRDMGRSLEKKCPGSRAFVVRDAIHGWDLQFPELFARGVAAWVENGDFPREFEELD